MTAPVLSGLCSDDLHEACDGTVALWACSCDCHKEPVEIGTWTEQYDGEGAQL